MDEYGETPTIYVWPAGHEEGAPFPEDFWDRLREGLESVGLDWEAI